MVALPGTPGALNARYFTRLRIQIDVQCGNSDTPHRRR